MNAKRAKSLRRSLRELGHDSKERAYLSGKPRFKGMTGTVVLDPQCGRAMYQAAKREVMTS